MTYDAILAIRGWGPDHFDRASRPFMAAVRHALFAERLAPVLDQAEETRSMVSGQGLSPVDRARLGSARVAAGALIAQAQAVLSPPDEEADVG